MDQMDRQCAWGDETGPNGPLDQLERALRCASGCGCGVHVECSEMTLEALVAALEQLPPAGPPAEASCQIPATISRSLKRQ